MPADAHISPDARRAAEERVFERYKVDLLHTMEIPPERRETYEPVWPLEEGRIRTTEAFQGIFVEDTYLEHSYPDTVMVIVFRHFLKPQCRFATQRAIWHLDDLTELEPQFNDVFTVNLGEWVARFRPERHECRSDEPVLVGRVTPWSQMLPRIAAGEVELGSADRALAQLALAQLNCRES